MTSPSDDDELVMGLTHTLTYFESRLNELRRAIEAVVYSPEEPKETTREFAERLHGICIGDTSDD